ncbi:hypothetical protein H7F10_08415 [Acidithiobacillus sp. HP-6]|jgi:hypothetical protein|uniref:hypothetical protein n=1 Tax=unclassified Acidithiobacillus TaxID=2614800 RepID=UPI001879CFE0|nr:MULTISPECIES: hypothetical protein [unclassified Acidithiobacillus]MBE7562977.1 hypothetical protein [Acidithiobacillus sp. HP-6]MBE7566952.1 hypothetical protein [Acidithiobacillus sp. HP-11]MBE7569886.1 hypothetical protein [Acidithiobacillus sp. HP-2]
MTRNMIDRLPLPPRQKQALRQARISEKMLADAIVQRDQMSMEEKAILIDRIAEIQPQLIGSIVVLFRMGIPEARLEMLVDLLLMLTLALDQGGITLPAADEDLVEQCYERVTRRMTQETDLRVLPMERQRVSQDYIEQHPEQWLLSYVFHLINPLTQSSEEDRVVTLLVTTALNYVEIVTELLHPRWERKQAH